MKAVEIIYSKGLTPDLERTTTISGLKGTISKEKGSNGICLCHAMCITKADNQNPAPLTSKQMLDIAFCCDCLYTDLEVEPLEKDILFKNFKVKSLKQ